MSPLRRSSDFKDLASRSGSFRGIVIGQFMLLHQAAQSYDRRSMALNVINRWQLGTGGD